MYILLSLLIPVLVSVVFLPKILRFLAELVGQHLRRASRTRRELLLARVATESKSHEAERKNRQSEDDDWEEVGTNATRTPVDSGKTDRDWDGIVGFFHPFWYGQHL